MYKRWTKQVVKEFYAQGDKEKERGLQISAFFDREKPEELERSQHGFINFIVRPAFEAWGAMVPNLMEQFEANLDANYLVDWSQET